MTMGFADYLQLALLVLTVIGFAAMQLNRYAVANGKDRLALITSGAANVAGDIRDTLNQLPPGANYATAKAALIADALPAFAAEFRQSGAKIGATNAKLSGIIAGQVGQIPPATAAPAAAADPATTVENAVQKVIAARTALSALDPASSADPATPVAALPVSPIPTPPPSAIILPGDTA